MLESQRFLYDLQLYRAGRLTMETLSLDYDLLWNRLDIFSSAAKPPRRASGMGSARRWPDCSTRSSSSNPRWRPVRCARVLSLLACRGDRQPDPPHRADRGSDPLRPGAGAFGQPDPQQPVLAADLATDPVADRRRPGGRSHSRQPGESPARPARSPDPAWQPPCPAGAALPRPTYRRGERLGGARSQALQTGQ